MGLGQSSVLTEFYYLFGIDIIRSHEIAAGNAIKGRNFMVSYSCPSYIHVLYFTKKLS